MAKAAAATTIKVHEPAGGDRRSSDESMALPQLAVEEFEPSSPPQRRLGSLPPKARSAWAWLAFPGEVARPPAGEPCSARRRRA